MQNSSFTSLVIPEGVTSIGTYGIRSNTKLEEIDFPSTLTSIGLSGLAYCSKVMRMTFRRSTAPSLGNTCFYNFPSNGTLYIPTGATGYSGGQWDTYLFNKGWTLEYLS